jgi:hypothetical protein
MEIASAGVAFKRSLADESTLHIAGMINSDRTLVS